MGVVAKEAGRSSVALALGLVAGTVNTVLVLPRAFDGAEEYWGLIRVLTAWSGIIAPLLTLGGNGIIMRRSRLVAPDLRGALHGSTWLIAGIMLAVWASILWWNGDAVLGRLDAEEGGLLVGHLGLFLLMNALTLVVNLSNSHLVIELKGSWTKWVTEVWLKMSYLVLACALLFGHITVDHMVPAYVLTWVVGTALLVVFMWRSGAPVHFRRLRELDWRENLQYGGYASLTAGAAVIATNLDFVMVGSLLGLSVVPVYTMGFFIGSVVLMPQRALASIFSGLLAAQIAENKPEVVQPFIQQHARVTLLLGTTVFAGVLSGLTPLIGALPIAYAGITGIAIAIGFQRIILGSTSATNIVLGHTPHYRLNLPINLGLLVTTVFTNWLFMSVFDWGVTGAALATLFTAVWNASWRLSIVYKKVGIHPFTWSWVAIFAIGGVVGTAGLLTPILWDGHGYLEAIVRGGLASTAVLGTAYFAGLFPELKTAVQQRWGGRFN